MFQITLQRIERSSTLSRRDVGQWAMIVQGCIQFLGKDEDAARKRYDKLREILRK